MARNNSRKSRRLAPMELGTFTRTWLPIHHVEALLNAHHLAIGKDLPQETHAVRDTQSAILNACVLSLVAFLEAYVEDTFGRAARAFYSELSDSDLTHVVEQPIRNFHNPKPNNIDRLFLLVGCARVTHDIEPHRKTNVRESVERLVDTRHKIAHGTEPKKRWLVSRREVERWRTHVEILCGHIEKRVLNRA
ncbi:MAG: hypothetical protein JNL08_05830 [Planctomycetes bacterium]|nr:hypothetical protein [Planctomycetota bacterium]